MENNELWKKVKKPKITIKDILYGLIEAPINAILVFDKYKPYRVSASALYIDERFNCEDLAQKLYQMKKRKLIRRFIENNELYLELTDKGKKILAWEEIDKILDRKKIWDGKFRLVMFDVPEDKKTTRDIVRDKLNKIGFLQFQKSVFIYPHECKNEINTLTYYCCATRYLKYLVVDIIEGEEEIITRFIDKGILNIGDLERR